jgi:hypothetical protein
LKTVRQSDMKALRDDNTPSPPVGSPRRAELLEIAAALERLTENEMNRLERLAVIYTKFGILKGEAEDLINQAIMLTLTGRYH